MKYLNRFNRALLIIFFTLPFYITGCNSEDTGEVSSITNTDADGSTSVDEAVLDEVLNSLPLDDLSTAETK